MDDYYKGKKLGESTEGLVEQTDQDEEMRKGPWSVEEDTVLINYVATHGHARWNSIARSSGLKRSGKSCRLRWLNYLRPDVRRGNITLQEQITILHLHSRWGNRWSKIAEHLPGRTDNEIKNYWRTKVMKQAQQLKCDVNSDKFRDALRHVLIPLLLERLHPPCQLGPSPSPIQTQAQAHLHQQLTVHSDSGSSLNSQMFECTNLPLDVDVDVGGGGDLWLESLWNDDSIYGFSHDFPMTSK